MAALRGGGTAATQLSWTLRSFRRQVSTPRAAEKATARPARFLLSQRTSAQSHQLSHKQLSSPLSRPRTTALHYHRPRRTPLTPKRTHMSQPPKNPTNTHLPPASPPAAESLSLTQRLRKLSREYGYAALGVYFALSALDFPFCLLTVRWLGTERIGRWEEVAKEWVWGVLGFNKKSDEGEEEVVRVGEPTEGQGWGVEQAQRANEESGASIWTQVALAYAIHKSFIFIRVPITAAITPKVVKVLRGWGWDIGKRSGKGKVKAASSAS